MRYLISPLLIFLLFAMLSLHCAGSDVSGGGTIETTNGIVGVIRNSDNSPSASAVVKLFLNDFDPLSNEPSDETFTDTTDDDGIYRFNNLQSGNYTVIARNQKTKSGYLTKDIAVNQDSVTSVPAGILQPPGSISFDFSLSNIPDDSYVYIPGTDIGSLINTDGSVVLADVPAGDFSTIILSSDENDRQNILRNEITVSPEETTNIEQPLWKYSTRIFLNTTTSGADITDDIYNFPVLIRIDENNFDFSQASPDGSDLMFSGGTDTTRLSYEIEYWNTEERRAAIWVLIDTVRGENDTQSIRMYWGNSSAKNASSGSSVFDTTLGFQGIWHLGEDTGNPSPDATQNGFHGMSTGASHPQTTEGIIGNCRIFDGIDDYITMPNTANSRLDFPANGNYTISAWVKTDAFENQSQLIVAKGYEQYFLRFTYFPVNAPLWEFTEFSENETWQACTTTATDGEWILLTGVKQGDKQLLYCNGIPVDSTPNSYSIGKSRDTSYDLSFGKFLEIVNLPNDTEGYCFFKGSIDEVRIHDTTRSPLVLYESV